MASPAKINAVADWFINHIDRDSGETITHLKLQKLLYFAQAWYLANTGGKLFEEDFQAWAHGPVARSIYDRFTGRAWEPIEVVDAPEKVSKEVAEYLQKVFQKYGIYGAKKLEKLTHSHAPWQDARGGLPAEARCETVISKSAMRDYYGKKIKKSWK